MEGKLIFVTGGARSGKSSFAEKYAEEIARIHVSNLYYLATSKPVDKEMQDRIKRHQADRYHSEAEWKTIESPVDIKGAIQHFRGVPVVLLDCITILLTNELFQADFEEQLFKQEAYQKLVVQKIVGGIHQISQNVTSLLVVSNEVLFDPIDKENDIVYIYQKLLGKIHQQLVADADEAYLVEFGIPIRKK